MKFIHKKSDEEIIERIRKSYKNRWLSFSILLLFSIIIISSTIYWGHEFEKRIQELSNDISYVDESNNGMENLHSFVSNSFGFRIGLFVGKGIMAGLFFIIFAFSIINRRRDAILLEYYDKNKKQS
jgi:Fe2+ transport system protein B